MKITMPIDHNNTQSVDVAEADFLICEDNPDDISKPENFQQVRALSYSILDLVGQLLTVFDSPGLLLLLRAMAWFRLSPPRWQILARELCITFPTRSAPSRLFLSPR